MSEVGVVLVDREFVVRQLEGLTPYERLVYLTMRDVLAQRGGKFEGMLVVGRYPLTDEQIGQACGFSRPREVVKHIESLIQKQRVCRRTVAGLKALYIRDFKEEQGRTTKRIHTALDTHRRRVRGQNVDKSSNAVDNSSRSVENRSNQRRSAESGPQQVSEIRATSPSQVVGAQQNGAEFSADSLESFRDNVYVEDLTTTSPATLAPRAAPQAAAPPPPVPTARVEVLVRADGSARATEGHGGPLDGASVEADALEQSYGELERLFASRTEGRIVGPEADFIGMATRVLDKARERKSKPSRSVGTGGGGAAAWGAARGARVSEEVVRDYAIRCIDVTCDPNPIPGAWENVVGALLAKPRGYQLFDAALDALSKARSREDVDERLLNAAGFLMNRLQRACRAS